MTGLSRPKRLRIVLLDADGVVQSLETKSSHRALSRTDPTTRRRGVGALPFD